MTTTDSRPATTPTSGVDLAVDLAEPLRALHASMSRAGIVPPDAARPEAEVKAEALSEAATAQRAMSQAARTGNGRAEHEAVADWLDERAADVRTGDQ